MMEKLDPNSFEEINIVPMQDSIMHIDGLECPCCPTWDAKNQWDLLEKKACRMMIVHRKVCEETLQ